LKADVINHFNCEEISVDQIALHNETSQHTDVIVALDGQLITEKLSIDSNLLRNEAGNLVSNTTEDILKIIVVNRYMPSKISIGFIRNFGLQYGALASSVAHDSHNIVAVGVNDEDIVRAVNLIVRSTGGVSLINHEQEIIIPLPVAGLMSNEDGYAVAVAYEKIDRAAKDAGSKLGSPFMTLSFMALLVIPHLKLSDKGLFDGDNFKLI
jgi:adenine deaminase